MFRGSFASRTNRPLFEIGAVQWTARFEIYDCHECAHRRIDEPIRDTVDSIHSRERANQQRIERGLSQFVRVITERRHSSINRLMTAHCCAMFPFFARALEYRAVSHFSLARKTRWVLLITRRDRLICISRSYSRGTFQRETSCQKSDRPSREQREKFHI